MGDTGGAGSGPGGDSGTGPGRTMTTEHGYNAYASGCRCEVCRDAKAAYMREARARRWRTLRLVRTHGTGRNFVDGITHGYSGYQNYACRCAICTAASSERHAGRAR